MRERERLSGKLAPIERRIERARDTASKGLRTKSANRQKGIFEGAAKSLEHALKDLDKLEATSKEQPATLEQVETLRAIAKR